MEAIETYEVGGGEYRISIYPDTFANDPSHEFDFYTDAEKQAYLAGEVYGFEVVRQDGEFVDSCWGFYGANGWSYMIEVAMASAAYDRKERRREAKRVREWAERDVMTVG